MWGDYFILTNGTSVWECRGRMAFRAMDGLERARTEITITYNPYIGKLACRIGSEQALRGKPTAPRRWL